LISGCATAEPVDITKPLAVETMKQKTDVKGQESGVASRESGVKSQELRTPTPDPRTPNPDPRPPKLKIGCILTLSGEGASIGQRVLEGIQLAFNSLIPPTPPLEKGGVDLILRDSEGDTSAVSLLEGLAKDEDVIAVIGPIFSKSVINSVRTADKYKIPVFSPTASSRNISGISPYIFRNSLTNQIQGESLADYAVNNLNLKKFAILYQRAPYGIEMKNVFEEKVKSLGGEIIFSEPFDPDQNDFEPQIMTIGGMRDSDLKKIVDAGKPKPKLQYDAIFIPGAADRVGLILPELTYYNISGVTLLGGNGLNSPDLVRMGGKYTEGIIFVDGFFPASEKPAVKEFVERYKIFYNKEPDIFSAQAYDAARIILSLIKNGANNREEIKNSLLNLKDYNGASGATAIQPSGDSQKTLFFLTVKNGKIVEIK
jgi:ABC-type branched-subunit amino acid transport system substrate-binding protein